MDVQEELLLELKPYIDRGSIVVDCEIDGYWQAANDGYPVCGTAIDSRKVPGAIHDEASPDAFVEKGYQFFCYQDDHYNLGNLVCVMSDNALDVALLMTKDTLRQCLKRLLELPQHLYVFADDFSWCMAFRMEGDIDFGYRP